jgi:hypothetical protein
MAKSVVFAIPGNDSLVWGAFAEELLRQNGHSKAIQHVAIDCAPPAPKA